jgi:translation initiation factor eIF-2B subunit epsilon
MVGDFIVVSGDIISNFPIVKALQQHKARREKDKNVIMTMILREAEPGIHDHSGGIVPTFVLDPTKDRCLHYEEALPGTQFTSHIEPELLKTPELEIRQDLVDCRIDICTPDVLSLWSDNFDNQSPRKDFLFGVLKDWELNGKTIHTYVVEDDYAARVADFWSYNCISQDLRSGLVTSIAVENNAFGNTHYNRSQNGIIVDGELIAPRPTQLDYGTIVGPQTTIGRGSEIRNSVIGARCLIGNNANIENAYIWDDVSIGNNVKISRAIVGNEAFIGENSVVEEGSLISFGVRIAPGTTVKGGSRICRPQPGMGGEAKSDAFIVGDAGEGQAYADDEEDYLSSRLSRLIYQKPEFANSISTLDSDLSSEEVSSFGGSRSQSFGDEPSDRFQHDTVAILVQRMQDGTHVDDMLSELMGLRFSGGADETQVRKAVAVALMKHIHGEIENGMSAANATRRILTAYNTLIRRKAAVQSAEEQAAFLLDAQRDLTRRKDGGKTLLFVAKDLYDLGVFTEEAFSAWWADERSSSESAMAEVRKSTSPFIEWLENAESESESEEEDDD